MSVPRSPVLSVDCGPGRATRMLVLAAGAGSLGVVYAAGLAWPVALSLAAACAVLVCHAAMRPGGTLHWYDGGWWWQQPGLYGAVHGPLRATAQSALGRQLVLVTLRTGRGTWRTLIVHRARAGEARWRLLRTLLRHPPTGAEHGRYAAT